MFIALVRVDLQMAYVRVDQAAQTKASAMLKSILRVVHRGDQTAASGRGQRVFRNSNLGYIEREPVAVNCLPELVEESLRLDSAPAQHDRYRLVDPRQVLLLGQRAAQRLHQRQDYVLVVDVKRALVLVLRRTGQIETLFLDQPNPGRQFAGHVSDIAVDVVAGFVHAEGHHRNRHESERDVAHSAAAAYADAGEVFLLQLREHNRESLVDALRVITHRV